MSSQIAYIVVAKQRPLSRGSKRHSHSHRHSHRFLNSEALNQPEGRLTY
jgi:hypothetical protein